MTKEKINESNETIALFMEGEHHEHPEIYLLAVKYGKRVFKPSDFKYHLSWDWLMPVLEKIIQYKFDDGDTAYPRTFGIINAETGQRMVRINRHGLFEAPTLIEATWCAIVDFIEGHNREEFMDKNKLGEQDIVNDVYPCILGKARRLLINTSQIVPLLALPLFITC